MDIAHAEDLSEESLRQRMRHLAHILFDDPHFLPGLCSEMLVWLRRTLVTRLPDAPDEEQLLAGILVLTRIGDAVRQALPATGATRHG